LPKQKDKKTKAADYEYLGTGRKEATTEFGSETDPVQVVRRAKAKPKGQC